MTTTTEPQEKRAWTEIGKEVIGRRLEGGARLTRAAIVRAIDTFEWVETPADPEAEMTLPIVPALAIQAAIKELRIPKVTRIAWRCHELAPHGFYGIEGNYKNGRVRVYVVDTGTHLIPVRTDFWPKAA